MRRASLLLVALLVLAGATACDWSKPGGETVEATPETVVGTVPTETQAKVPPQFANGSAEAGAVVFKATAGCGGCHTLKAAGTNGQVGPNLDDAQPDLALIVQRVTKGQGAMPSFQGQLSNKQIADVAAYVFASTHGGG